MRDKVDAALRVVLVSLMALLVVDVVWQVFSRYVLGAPSTFTDELARFLLIWVSLLGAAYASGRNMHIGIDILPSRLAPTSRLTLDIFIDLLVVVFVFAVLVFGAGMLVYTTYTYRQLTPTLQIPMAFVYLVGPISGLIIIYYKLSDIRMHWRSLSRYSLATPREEPKAAKVS